MSVSWEEVSTVVLGRLRRGYEGGREELVGGDGPVNEVCFE